MGRAVFVLLVSMVLLSTAVWAGDEVARAGRIEVSSSKADVPRLISYQGTLTDASGMAIDTTVSMIFSIYADSTGGLALWAETQAVEVASGMFNVFLGRSVTIPVDLFGDPERWLGVQVGADDEIEPRQRIGAVGYAFWAAVADTAEYARGAPVAGVDSVVHAVYSDTADHALAADPDSDWTISGSDIYSAASGRVGIGTTSPAGKLHVKTDSGAEYVHLESESAPFGLIIKDFFCQWALATSPAGLDGSFGIWDVNAGLRALVDTAGNVGIGTPSPAERLDVAGTAKVTGFKMATGASDGYILTTDASGMASWQPATAVTETVVTMEMHSEGNVIVDSVLFAGTISSLSPLELQAPEGQTRMFISDSTGNVGINKMNPAARLDVNGEINTNSTYQIGGQRAFAVDDSFNTFVGSGTGTLYSGMYGTFVGCRAGSTNTGSRNTFIGHKAGCNTGSGAGNVFLGYMAGYNETGSDKLLIANGADSSDVLLSGNFALGMVGIGTLNPTQKLHVYGASNPRVLIEGSTPELNLKNGSDLYQLYMVDDDLWFYKDAFNVVFTGDGKVGIGTYSPDTRLTIEGPTDGMVLAKINQTGGRQYAGLRLDRNDTEKWFIGMDHVSDHLIFRRSASSNEMAIDTLGNVGIGTKDPPRKLWVSGDAGGTTAWYNDSDERLKKNIAGIDDALEKVSRLEGVYFEWRDTENRPEGSQLGMIAQQVNDVVPEVVERKGEYYSMATANLVPLLVEAIKEQQEQIEELRAELEALR